MNSLFRGFLGSRAAFHSHSSFTLLSSKNTMKQIAVDAPEVKASLGDMQMRFVKKAEKMNAERAKEYSSSRRNTVIVGSLCVTIAASIYTYTIYAIKQETFLDDFDMPDPMLPVTEQK